MPDDLAIPPALALSPADEARTFHLPPGFRIELVAAEPLVHDPVAMAWDDRERLWVCEMRGFMPNVDGEGETEPVGSIVVLTDTDGDGRMDERAVFLDGLVLPRALLPIHDGLLYIEPPDLVFARDEDGDGTADTREVVDTGLGGIASPEHAVNGLMLGLDNWIHCANHSLSYRLVDGEWRRRRTAGGGQWGITKDDLGRIFFDTNPDPLRGDPYPSHYAVRNPNHGTAAGVNVRYAKDLRVWPVRMTPGVNRGYREGLLNEDFELTKFTAACGPLIHRGDALPPELRGDAFVCEPAGNLVKRFVLSEKSDGSFVATNAREGPDFLASTDERFRPVNLYDGPDGALYVVDMYRGVIQHKIFVTSFLREQIVARGLEEPIGLGRIWRIVHEEHAGARGPDLEEASWSELMACLSHPNGWWRDTAQRAIVAEGADSRDARELLQREALYGESPLGRMHALWALEGIERLDPGLLMGALHDDDPGVLLAAVRVSEPFLHVEPRLVERLSALAHAGDPRVRRQVILSLGENPTEATDGALLALLDEGTADAEERSWFLSGLHRRELAFLDRLVPERWADDCPGRSGFVQALARAVAREGRSDAIGALLGSIDR
ncbi:MAG: dehydrogenase, partial [Planctomycetota bacterium]|nr:dehydrogenase [Planctomycetota bacterium]